MVTVVTDFGQLPLGKLLPSDYVSATLKLTRILRAAGVEIAFGASDFSVNADEVGAAPWVQLQYLLFTLSVEPFRSTMLRSVVNRSNQIRRPIRIEKFDGDAAGLAYALKYEFVKREEYSQQRADRVCRNTRSRPLRGTAAVGLSLLLDQIGIRRRIILIGVKRIWSNDEVRMQLIK
jgi:hypothetical protein